MTAEGHPPRSGTQEVADATTLCAHFQAARPDLTTSAELGAALRSMIEAARAAWPDVELSDEAFVRFVASKLPVVTEVEESLRALHTADLYLACGCARGEARALARFELACGPPIERALDRLRVPTQQRVEIRQQVRQRLLAPRPNLEGGAPLPPRIADFSGRGSLGSWVRVVAAREAVERVRRQGREQPTEDDELARRLEPDAGPELVHLKQLYRDEFKAAFAEAIAALPKRDRALLRQHALDGLSIDRLAALYDIHRATAARRVEAARRAVFEQTRLSLGRRLRVSAEELDSVMRLIRSRLDVTLGPLLRDPDEGEGGGGAAG
ncbi:MAG TPA: sigma-70 family RNA polymerase sigma factor [Polyangiaceae bacterium]|nr:sigma-70 family RNA polymerase sigma factor [Polyangiaceae bacterium]